VSIGLPKFEFFKRGWAADIEASYNVKDIT
jgi:hypothetical protein